MAEVKHLTWAELEAGLADIRQSPRVEGVLEMIVRRPDVDQREIVTTGILDLEEGLVGDNWMTRGSSMTGDGSAHPEMQLNVINTRLIALIAQEKERWPLAGDQLFVDLDLSVENLPSGSRLEIGSTVIEVTPIPHNGCKKFAARFGQEAIKFVNSAEGKQLRLRGMNAKVVQPGIIRPGDVVRKI